jgi:hypothetical protein
MKILTTVTNSEGYFELLKQSAGEWGYELEVLGWGRPWKGFCWKIELYVDRLKNFPEEQPVICVDGYDVVVVGPSREMHEKFKGMNQPVVFSGQRYFPGQSMIRRMADQLMSDSRSNYIRNRVNSPYDYSRPCMGILVGYAGKLLSLFQKLLDIEKREKVNNDQILLNKYYLENPGAIHIDTACTLFQNLWRTGPGLFGKITPGHKKCEVEVYYPDPDMKKRIRNKKFNTTACFIHGPFNLDMSPLLNELGHDALSLDLKKSWHYWQYSIIYFLKRGFRFFGPKILLATLGIVLVIIGILIFINRCSG